MAIEVPAGCLAFDEDLSALVDEELSPAREAEVRGHVDACDRCALRLQQLCNVDLELAGLASPPVSPALSRDLAARIAAEPEPGARPAVPAAAPRGGRAAPPAVRRRWLAGSALARAALAAGLVLAAWLLLRGDETAPPDRGIVEAPVPPAGEAPPPGTGEPAPRELLAERPPLEVPAPLDEVPAPQAVPDEAPGPPPPRTLAEAPAPAAGEVLADLPAEDLAMLLELEDVEDLDLIANLELLETLADLGPEAG